MLAKLPNALLVSPPPQVPAVYFATSPAEVAAALGANAAPGHPASAAPQRAAAGARAAGARPHTALGPRRAQLEPVRRQSAGCYGSDGSFDDGGVDGAAADGAARGRRARPRAPGAASAPSRLEEEARLAERLLDAEAALLGGYGSYHAGSYSGSYSGSYTGGYSSGCDGAYGAVPGTPLRAWGWSGEQAEAEARAPPHRKLELIPLAPHPAAGGGACVAASAPLIAPPACGVRPAHLVGASGAGDGWCAEGSGWASIEAPASPPQPLFAAEYRRVGYVGPNNTSHRLPPARRRAPPAARAGSARSAAARGGYGAFGGYHEELSLGALAGTLALPEPVLRAGSAAPCHYPNLKPSASASAYVSVLKVGRERPVERRLPPPRPTSGPRLLVGGLPDPRTGVASAQRRPATAHGHTGGAQPSRGADGLVGCAGSNGSGGGGDAIDDIDSVELIYTHPR